MPTLRLATRKSPLALAQSQMVADALKAKNPGLTVELVEISSAADDAPDKAVAAFGQEGIFVKALEDALLGNQADIAVHSLKDVPTEVTEGLELSVFLEREDPRDVLVAKDPKGLIANPAGKKIGTSSLRRKAFLRRLMPGVEVVDLRGNVDTRLAKVEAGELDGVVLSLAGLKRLGKTGVTHHVFGDQELPPAVGQGVLTIETRQGDSATQELVKGLNHADTEAFALCEREFLREIKGGCLVPVGVKTSFYEEYDLLLEAWIADPDGDLLVHGSHHQRKEAPVAIGSILASRLSQHGGQVIINKIRGIDEPVQGGDSAEEPAG